MVVCAVIMAGGKEMRFGPVKKYLGSKSTIRISGREEMILETVLRCDEIVESREDVYIITNKDQKSIFDAALKRKASREKYYIPNENFFIEPEPKNTAHCILYSALKLKQKYKDDSIIMCVFPSDHDIPNDKININLFKDSLNKAIKVATMENKLITIGIDPTFPATGYGYIKYCANEEANYGAMEVYKFKEKPNEEKAEFFASSKTYLWNSGIFVWQVNTLIEQYRELFNKEIYNEFCRISNRFYIDPAKETEDWKKVYKEAKPISIDYAILEETNPDNLRVVLGQFDWQDIGKWDALLAISTIEQNIIDVDIIGVDILNRTIYSTGKHVYDNNLKTKSTNKSFVWLHCNECDKDKIRDILNSNDYDLKDFNSIEINSLKTSLLKNDRVEKGNAMLNKIPKGNKVFIVHGRDNIKYDVARTIDKSGFEAVILDEQANLGDTLIEKLERVSNVGYAVIVLTPDDSGKLKTDSEFKPRARQNVIAEFGYFLGKIGRSNICILYSDGVEIPSDFEGIAYIKFDTGGAWRYKLIEEINEA